MFTKCALLGLLAIFKTLYLKEEMFAMYRVKLDEIPSLTMRVQVPRVTSTCIYQGELMASFEAFWILQVAKKQYAT